jgi:hypothetical protein
MKTRSACLTWWLVLFLASPLTLKAYYDPGQQRWVNRDPTGEEGGVNLHAVLNNAPVNEIDPDGHQCFFGGLPPILLQPPPVVPPRLMLPPPRPWIPPYGLRPNPFRLGSWGRLNSKGRFEEIWRFDRGQPGAPGWRGIDHLHFNGGKQHLPMDTPISFGSGGTINSVPTTVKAPKGTTIPENLVPKQPTPPRPCFGVTPIMT